VTAPADLAPPSNAVAVAEPLSAADLVAVFSPAFSSHAAIGLAVSGGSDSLAMMVLAAAWAQSTPGAPRLHILTVDHGLRPQARADADAVAQVAGTIGLSCDILTWQGTKPATGVQAAARAARYRLLVEAARARGLMALATAHTLEDQAETVLMRLARGSGLKGLAGMAPHSDWLGLPLLRPLLSVSRARLAASLRVRGIAHREDPSNGDRRFERVRWRALLPVLGAEGLDAGALARFAGRCRRADEALEAVADEVMAQAVVGPDGKHTLAREVFRAAPLDVQIRVLARLVRAVMAQTDITKVATLERVVRDEKLANLAQALAEQAVLRRTLGGAEFTARGTAIHIRRENPRRTQAATHPKPARVAYGLTRDDHTDPSVVLDPDKTRAADRFTTARD
jgi:tRNA(Ile)-lysidine synthase